MAERPIIFSSEMICAILDGTKSQTRRVIKPQPPEGWTPKCVNGMYDWVCFNDKQYDCPYGRVGDLLWVKEEYQILRTWYNRQTVEGVYLSDDSPFDIDLKEIKLLPKEWEKYIKRKWPHAKTSGQFMYKSLARIWLEIIGIKVERVQDISGKDAQREGWPREFEVAPLVNTNDKAWNWFQRLWDSINAKRGYDFGSNPFVWCIEFKRMKGGN